MIEIDHNPHERRPGNGVWWIAWIGVALLWVWYFAYREFDRDSLLIGAATGMLLTAWAIDITGNKAPSWMIPKGKPRVRR